jgi:shikimate dehydrogenase
MVDKYGLLGENIAQSKSFFIYHEFAKQAKKYIQYTAQAVPAGQLITYLLQCQKEGYKGLNVTAPFKQQVFNLLQCQQESDKGLNVTFAKVTRCSKRAQMAKAVNTITFLEDQIIGYNTDGIGLIRDLTRQRISLEGKKILILGAGGAVRGILQPLLGEKPEQIVIANRTKKTAENLAKEFQPQGNLYGCGLAELQKKPFDLIINCTSGAPDWEKLLLSPAIINEQTFCYDLNYGQKLTPFLIWAQKRGAEHSCDGIGMLVEQAAESFFVWTKMKPETNPVIKLLRSHRSDKTEESLEESLKKLTKSDCPSLPNN